MKNMNYLAQLLVIGSLLDKIEDLGGERLMNEVLVERGGSGDYVHRKKTHLLSQGVSLGVNLLSHLHFLLSALLAKK